MCFWCVLVLQCRILISNRIRLLLAAINNLLDSITEKDEGVRNAIEQALGRMAERRPNETMMALCDFKAKQPKLPEQQTAIVLRY